MVVLGTTIHEFVAVDPMLPLETRHGRTKSDHDE
jgi:hypothetical protein